MKASASLSADAERSHTSPDLSVAASAEAALFDALEQVFLLDRRDALRLSREAFGAIASFLADVSASSVTASDEARAMAQFDEMRGELEELKRQLSEFVANKPVAVGRNTSGLS